jgi:DNA modification methylase
MANNNIKPRKKDSAKLVWSTKPRRAPNPKDIEFQTAEVVLPNPKTVGELPLSFRNGLLGETDLDKQKMNRLIWGDNLLAMQALLNQGYEGKINLIYIDPPFDSKADYSHRMTITPSVIPASSSVIPAQAGIHSSETVEFTKEPSVIERLAYKDTWTGGTDSYLDMLYPRLQLMKRLLAEDGSIYVHCDWHADSYIRIMLDEIFGRENLVNELVWHYRTGNVSEKQFQRKHDIILFYSKSDSRIFIPQEIKEYYFCIYGPDFKPGFGGRKSGKDKYGEYRISLIDDVWDISAVFTLGKEHTSFNTQKPQALLERIINASSNKGDLVADFFAGSGTTGIVAEELGRRWIMCELGKVGIQVTRARLVEMAAKPFLIENIGNYQREMIYLTGGRIWEMQTLILKLYGATPRDKTSGLGIRKIDNLDELVYVGYPDRPITAKKAEELALQSQNLDGVGYKRLVILGWDYEYNYSEALESRLKALKDKIRVEIKSRDIPPDIYDYLKKAKSEEDIEPLVNKINFYERPYLKLSAPQIKDKGNGKIEITISIDKYVLMDIPVSQDTEKGRDDYAALMKLTKDNFAALIDYWAIDWDYDGCTFKSQWQAFRGNGRKAKTVITSATEVLEKKNNRIIAVRVVDIFGNDAAAIIKI